MDLDGTLEQSCDAMGVVVVRAPTKHDRTGMRYIDRKQFWMRMLFGYYIDLRMYTKLYMDKNAGKRVWKENISMAVKEFHTYAVHMFSAMKHK